MSVNKAILVGNVGGDPELKAMGNGKTKASFSLATSERWTDKNSNEKKERTFWHRVVVFNEGLVHVCEHYVRKGSKIYLEGAIQTREWDDGGTKKYVTEIVLQGFGAQIVLLDRKEGGNRPPDASGPDDYGSTRTRESSSSGGAPAGGFGGMDDDIPFSPEWRG